MKYIIIAIIALLLTSCNKITIDYSIVIQEEVPDSLQEEYQEYLLDLVTASNQYHSAGNSKNKGDILYTARWQAEEVYSVKTKKLKVATTKGWNYPDVNYYSVEELNSGDENKFIYDQLLHKPLGFTITEVYSKDGRVRKLK